MPELDPWNKLLVLDLDETLIHARGRSQGALPWPPQRQVAHYRVWLRPGVQAFLSAVLERFAAVGVWTSGTADYAAMMLEHLCDPERLRFVYGRERCARGLDEAPGLAGGLPYWIKDIRELEGFGFDPGQILFVDDRARGLERSYGNLISIEPFEGDPADRQLPGLLTFLDQLGPVEDVREIEKRGWAWAT